MTGDDFWWIVLLGGFSLVGLAVVVVGIASGMSLNTRETHEAMQRERGRR